MYTGAEGGYLYAKNKAQNPPQIGYPGNDPTKAPEGFRWKGKPNSTPGSKEGSFHDPNTGEALNPDLAHPKPIGPHWVYKDKNGDWWRVFPDGNVLPK